MAFEPGFIEEAKREIMLAPDGAKTFIAKKWSKSMGISLQHLYRIIKNGNGRKRTGAPLKPEYHAWAEVIYQIKKRPPEEAGELSTEDALALALKSGMVPEEAASVSIGTYNAIARQKGWTKTSIPSVRFQAERPNHAHHFDASTSKFFYIARREGDDFLLRIHRPAKHYKNKPVPVDALRPWIYGLVDDYSGRFICRYVAARGENSADSMEFLSWAWTELGLPEQLLCDQGMLKKALPSRDLMERLGIALPEMMPYAKRGHGKIERPWRTAWKKFETPFFAANSDYEKYRITLSELNSQLQNFINDKYNQLPHRFEKKITRLQAWSRVNLNGGIIRMPEGAMQTAASVEKRKVGIDGLISYKGQTYQVKGLYDAWAWIFESVFPSAISGQIQLVAQDIKTGQKYEVTDFVPLALGEFRAFADTPHQRLIKQSDEILRSAQNDNYITLYSDAKPKDEKVLSMPIRTKEERQIENPMELPDRYTNAYEAMKEFMSYLPGVFLSQASREAIEAEIQANGLSKAFVENFALEVRAQMVKREAM